MLSNKGTNWPPSVVRTRLHGTQAQSATDRTICRNWRSKGFGSRLRSITNGPRNLTVFSHCCIVLCRKNSEQAHSDLAQLVYANVFNSKRLNFNYWNDAQAQWSPVIPQPFTDSAFDIYSQKLDIYSLPAGKWSIVISEPVCLSDRTRSSGITRQNFNKFSVHVIYGHTWLSPPLAAL